MSVDKVQLQQQEVVNNEVVLTDINPVTSTSSVIDEASGSTMQQVLDRLWNAINNELSRVVNSVNNRSGVVVINANDVGLGNVDNVSFNDIKEWVVEYFKERMSNYHFRLFDNMQEVDELASTNDELLDGVPFYSATGISPDMRAYIGYFYWDDEHEVISYSVKAINVIGAVDNSLLYNETVGSRDYSNGRLGVNIHPDEKALYLENGVSKATSGLRIDPNKLTHKFVNSSCLYGGLSDTNCMLSANDATDGDPIDIYVDDVQIITSHGHHLHTGWTESLSLFGLVSTSFDSYYTMSNRDIPVLNGPNATLDLMDRQPAIGVVTKIIDDEHSAYEIRFYTIKTFQGGFGLKYYNNHQTTTQDTQLGVSFATNSQLGNLSGLQATGNGLLITDPESGPTSDENRPHIPPYRVMLPWGYNAANTNKGLRVVTDVSLATYPNHMLCPSGDSIISAPPNQYEVTINSVTSFTGSKVFENWSPLAQAGYSVLTYGTGEPFIDGPSNGYATSTSTIGLNFNKFIKNTNFVLLESEPSDWADNYRNYYTRSKVEDTMDDYIYTPITGLSAPIWEAYKYYKFNEAGMIGVMGSRMRAYDLSGLRLEYVDDEGIRGGLHSPEATNLRDFELRHIGIYDGKDSLGNDLMDIRGYNFSGGVSVNVGNYLEICPKSTDASIWYNDGGKVQVRIGDGLEDDVTYVELSESDPEPDDWFSYPERYIEYVNGVPKCIKYVFVPLESQPHDWVDFYYKYFFSPTQDEYMRVPKTSTVPVFEVGTYYEYIRLPWSLATQNLHDGVYTKIVQATRTNRFRVHVDNETVKFNSDKALTANPIVPVYVPNTNYSAGQLLTNDARTGVYIATTSFTSTSIYSDVNAEKLLVIVDPG